MKVEEEVPVALAGERLDRVVSIIADVSRAEATRLIESGGVGVDGEACGRGKLRLRQGQLVEVDLAMLPVEEPPAADATVVLDVVHEDADIIVLNKSAGVVVHPAPGHEGGTLVNGLLARYPEIAPVGEPNRPGIVHRLDAGTTGLMVVARTQRAYESLVESLAGHEVGRRYFALVWGRLESASLVIDAPIGRDSRDPLRMAVVNDGKWARTHVEVEAEFTEPHEVSILRCSLETGRTHQIRVHLAAIGHPVVGDTVYGAGRRSLDARRPMLHAAELSLDHPSSGERLTWAVPMPADMEGLIAGLAGAPDAR